MKSKAIYQRFLPIFMSVTLALTSLTPAFATQITEAAVQETGYPTEPSDEQELPISVSANNFAYAAEDEYEHTTSYSFNLEEENEPLIVSETESGTITVNLYDEDGATLIYGPITKDLSVLSSPSDGRYLFDTVNENGTSVCDPTQYANIPYIRNGKIVKWYNTQNGKTYSAQSLLTVFRFKNDTGLNLVYDTKTFNYSLTYDLDNGDYDTDMDADITIPYKFSVESETLPLPVAYKKGYTFEGWQITNSNAGDAYGQVITSIPAGSFINYTCADRFPADDSEAFFGYQLKAKFSPIIVQTPSIASVKNNKKGEAAVSIQAGAGETETVCYELSYSTNKNFKKEATHVVDLEKKTSYKITNMPKGKTYYFKVRAYKTDTKGEKIYSDASAVTKIKITKGVTETKKITKNSVALTASNVMIDADKNLYVKATAKNRLKSYDDFYYLVSIDPDTGKILKAVANADKNKTVIFKTPVRDDNGINLINGKYALAVKTTKKQYKQISSAFFIKNPEAAADYTAPYPVTKSKKGIQSYKSPDLGVQQSFTNFPINEILPTTNSGTKYVYNGKTYYFNEPSRLINFASNSNRQGITCSVQIMMSWPGTGKYKSLLYGTKTASSPTNWYAINASTPQSRELVEAAFSFLADRLSDEGCHVDNWILGNEVNIHPQWYYAGKTSSGAFMKNYANSFRILYNSVKGRNKNAHIFICTDHTWKNRSGDWGAKSFMDLFNSEIKGMNKNIQWNLAYHAYPAILYIPSTWKDHLAQDSINADFVTPKNLNILTDYVKKTYGKNTRIIISECGFTNASGETHQAAALAYSFYKAQFNDMIDAFIIRTEEDAPGETLRRLDGVTIDAAFGLVSSSGKKRASYDVFKYMDTPQYAKYTNKYLKTIGASGWSSVIPGFKDSTLKSMPNR